MVVTVTLVVLLFDPRVLVTTKEPSPTDATRPEGGVAEREPAAAARQLRSAGPTGGRTGARWDWRRNPRYRGRNCPSSP